MFAFLALAGDFGAMISPAMVGIISAVSKGYLKTGLLAGAVFPSILLLGLLILKKHLNKVGRLSDEIQFGKPSN